MFELAETVRIGAPVLGFFIPAAIFLISFIVTYKLMKHFLNLNYL